LVPSSRPDPVNRVPAPSPLLASFTPMFVALPVALFIIDVTDRVLAGKQPAAALFEISSASTTGPARRVGMFGWEPS